MLTHGVVAAALVLVAATIVLAAIYRRRARRRHSSAATVMEPRRVRRHSQLWTTWLAAVRFPQVMSYWCPMMGVYYAPPASAPVEVWDHAQLIVVTNNNGDLVLDFLVPDARAPRTSVPVTLHAHQLSSRQSETDLQRAIGAWITTSAFVDVELRRSGDRNLVRIHERHSFVTLELMSASGVN